LLSGSRAANLNPNTNERPASFDWRSGGAFDALQNSPQTRHIADRNDSGNVGILRLTSGSIFEPKNGLEGSFLSIVFQQVIDFKMVGMTGFEPATPCTPCFSNYSGINEFEASRHRLATSFRCHRGKKPNWLLFFCFHAFDYMTVYVERSADVLMAHEVLNALQIYALFNEHRREEMP
jgi:hypothetical protein